jgi:hypothetical protein
MTCVFPLGNVAYAKKKSGSKQERLVTYIQAYNGLYVSVKAQGKIAVDAKKVTKSEQFEVIPLSGGYHAFKSKRNGKYLSVSRNGVVLATASKVGNNEKLIIHQHQDYHMSFKAKRNGKWLTAVGSGKREFIANKKSISHHEKFEVQY